MRLSQALLPQPTLSSDDPPTRLPATDGESAALTRCEVAIAIAAAVLFGMIIAAFWFTMRMS